MPITLSGRSATTVRSAVALDKASSLYKQLIVTLSIGERKVGLGIQEQSVTLSIGERKV